MSTVILSVVMTLKLLFAVTVHFFRIENEHGFASPFAEWVTNHQEKTVQIQDQQRISTWYLSSALYLSKMLSMSPKAFQPLPVVRKAK